MTTANKITMVRILMIPFFIYFALQNDKISLIIALVLFCLASVTDFLDGYIARKNRKQKKHNIFRKTRYINKKTSRKI